MDRLVAMSMYVRVVETGSFSAVARELNTTQPTVSKNIAELENWLGAKLLNRSTRSLHLTEAGADYYQRCLSILMDVEEAEQNIGQMQTQAKGTLRINTVVAFGRLHIMPLIGEFLELYPEIKIDVLLNDRRIDLVEEGVDLAIRMGPLADSSLIAKKLTASCMVTVATQRYLDKWGMPEHPSELKNHNCILYNGRDNYRQLDYLEDGQAFHVRVDGNISSNNSEAIREALLSSYGIALVPRWLVGDALLDGSLCEVLKDFVPAEHDIFAVYPPGRHLPSKARFFIDFLAEKIGHCAQIGSCDKM
ncbi:MAG: LysR family transcriptional regulator [Pseudomonadales bacterium]|nr:LysR family transcriptional regulator [Pseudomonadales bacterium]